MKKRILPLLVSVLVVSLLASCDNKDGVVKEDTNSVSFPATQVVINDYFSLKRISYNVLQGLTTKILVDTLPGFYASHLQFESSDTSIATVDASGVITGVKQGFTTIKVSSDDGKVSNVVNVIVSKTITSSAATNIANTIMSDYNDPGRQTTTAMSAIEYVKDYYLCGDKIDHGTEGFEYMVMDYDNGYFMVSSEDLYVRAKNGDVEKESGTWIFFTMNYGLVTRCMHLSPTSKNYIDINTAGYTGALGDIIYDILDCLFVSGHSIATNMLEDADGKVNLASNISRMSSYQNFQGGAKDLFMVNDAVTKETVDAEAEIDYYDIPAGTVCDVDIHEEYLYHGAYVVSNRYDYLFKYKLGDENWSRDFTKETYFEPSVTYSTEQYEGELKELGLGYSLVDTFYDL